MIQIFYDALTNILSSEGSDILKPELYVETIANLLVDSGKENSPIKLIENKMTTHLEENAEQSEISYEDLLVSPTSSFTKHLKSSFSQH